MKINRNLQLWVVVATFLATVGVLFGGQILNTKLRVAQPLEQQLQKVKALKRFQVEPAGETLVLRLELRQSANLQTVLDQVKREVEFYHHKPVSEIRIATKADAKLEQAKYQLSFYLEEALVSGRFVELKTALDAMEKNQGIKARVYLDEGFIYLQLEEGRRYLYQAVTRPTLALGNNEAKGGSIQ